MPTDDPLSRISVMPTFRQPPPPPPPATDPDPIPSPDPTPIQAYPRPRPDQQIRLADAAGGRAYLAAAPAGERAPRTETSSDGDVHKPTPSEAAALMVGLVGILVAGASFLVRMRTRRKLREPTRQQTTDVAAPLGRILLRHADLAWLGPDIADGIKAAAATGAYLNDGPLLLGDAVDPGIPDHLQEDQES